MSRFPHVKASVFTSLLPSFKNAFISPLVVTLSCGLLNPILSAGGDCDLGGTQPGLCEDCDNNGFRDVCESELGTGLLGQYYRSDGTAVFSERLVTRLDSQVYFDWGNGSPGLGIPSDNFTVRWTGTVTVPNDGLQEISVVTDDGVRMWVGGILIIDDWTTNNGRETGFYDFTAGERVPIRLEYFELGGDARCLLEWRLDGESEFSPIPSDALRPDTDIDGDGLPDSCAQDCNANGIDDRLEVAQGLAEDCNGNCLPDECDGVAKDIAGYWRFETNGDVVVDSGPVGLNGSLGLATRVGDIGVPVIPQNGFSNRQSLSPGVDVVTVPDPTNTLTFLDESFTIEAWIKLDTLSNSTSGNGQRQYILQKKPLASFDSQLGYAFMAQVGNLLESSPQNFGKSTGISGRELCLRFGTGVGDASGAWSVTSFLEIGDNNWHYVSVAWDHDRAVARFVLDEQIDEVEAFDLGRIAGTGALRIGGHTNTSGELNQIMQGEIDEVRLSREFKPVYRLLNQPGSVDCNDNGVLDRCDIDNGTSIDFDSNGIPDECEDCNNNQIPDTYETSQGIAPDCNGNFLPDECDVADGTADCNLNGIPDSCDVLELDCNNNGVVDACDVSNGTSEDCQNDQIPDECQLTEDYVYNYSNFPEYGVRPDKGTHYTWMNAYRVENGANMIETVEISFVFVPTGRPFDLYIWQDPNGDFDPTDAIPLAGFQGVVNVPTECDDAWCRQIIELPEPVFVGDDGAVYFVGPTMRFDIPDDFPAGYDISKPIFSRYSWHIGTEGPLDPSNVSDRAVEYAPIDELIFAGNWDMSIHATYTTGDCNADGIVDICQIEDGELEDVDGNGVPDVCEDCNENGVLDAVDIADGTSLDCQLDGIPDECQLVSDCNQNGLPDSCDPDCDGDGLPDECELASGSKSDIDGNGVPDVCEDCNLNGIPDSLDLPPDGDSQDCHVDGIPDECQLGEADASLLANCDETVEGNLTVGTPSWLVWMESLTVEPGGEYLDSIELIVPEVPIGRYFTLFIGTVNTGGPGAAGPAEMDILLEIDRPVQTNDTWYRSDVPDTYIGPAGTEFYVGAMYYDSTPGWEKPAALDRTELRERSWIAFKPTEDPAEVIDLSQLAATAESFGRVGEFIADANFLLRAVVYDGTRDNDVDGDGVPDDCSGGGCTADINGDNVIDGADLTILLSVWDQDSSSGDLNGDGTVDGSDLTILLANWGVCR